MPARSWVGALIASLLLCLSNSAHAAGCASQLNNNSSVTSIIECIKSQGTALTETKQSAEQDAERLTVLDNENRSLKQRLSDLERGSPGSAIPVDAVVAFVRQCPEDLGWKPYGPGIARFVVGAGTPSDPKHETWKRRLPSGGFEEVPLSSYRLRESGGEEEHTLTEQEMPKHEHGMTGRLPSREFSTGNTPERVPTSTSVSEPWSDGADNPHNNMPPYIALYFCKKT